MRVSLVILALELNIVVVQGYAPPVLHSGVRSSGEKETSAHRQWFNSPKLFRFRPGSFRTTLSSMADLAKEWTIRNREEDREIREVVLVGPPDQDELGHATQTVSETTMVPSTATTATTTLDMVASVDWDQLAHEWSRLNSDHDDPHSTIMDGTGVSSKTTSPGSVEYAPEVVVDWNQLAQDWSDLNRDKNGDAFEPNLTNAVSHVIALQEDEALLPEEGNAVGTETETVGPAIISEEGTQSVDWEALAEQWTHVNSDKDTVHNYTPVLADTPVVPGMTVPQASTLVDDTGRSSELMNTFPATSGAETPNPDSFQPPVPHPSGNWELLAREWSKINRDSDAASEVSSFSNSDGFTTQPENIVETNSMATGNWESLALEWNQINQDHDEPPTTLFEPAANEVVPKVDWGLHAHEGSNMNFDGDSLSSTTTPPMSDATDSILHQNEPSVTAPGAPADWQRLSQEWSQVNQDHDDPATVTFDGPLGEKTSKGATVISIQKPQTPPIDWERLAREWKKINQEKEAQQATPVVGSMAQQPTTLEPPSQVSASEVPQSNVDWEVLAQEWSSINRDRDDTSVEDLAQTQGSSDEDLPTPANWGLLASEWTQMNQEEDTSTMPDTSESYVASTTASVDGTGELSPAGTSAAQSVPNESSHNENWEELAQQWSYINRNQDEAASADVSQVSMQDQIASSGSSMNDNITEEPEEVNHEDDAAGRVPTGTDFVDVTIETDLEFAQQVSDTIESSWEDVQQQLCELTSEAMQALSSLREMETEMDRLINKMEQQELSHQDSMRDLQEKASHREQMLANRLQDVSDEYQAFRASAAQKQKEQELGSAEMQRHLEEQLSQAQARLAQTLADLHRETQRAEEHVRGKQEAEANLVATRDAFRQELLKRLQELKPTEERMDMLRSTGSNLRDMSKQCRDIVTRMSRKINGL